MSTFADKFKEDPIFCGFVAIFSIQAILIGSIALSQRAQELALKKYHLALPWGQWALIQMTPSMYNFENRAYWSREGSTTPPRPLWLNHHSARTLHEVPLLPVKLEGCYEVKLDSNYRTTSVQTTYKTCHQSDSVTIQLETP